jgi:hypothetical protein
MKSSTMYSCMLGGCIIFLLGVFFYFTPFNEKPMKLIHSKTKFVVVEFQNDKVIFHDRFLEKEMKLRGIAIPPALRDQYEQKAFVKLQDPLFQKAFQEIYYPIYLAPREHVWENS